MTSGASTTSGQRTTAPRKATEHAQLESRLPNRLGIVRVVGLLVAAGLSMLLVVAALTTCEPSWWAESAPRGDVRALGAAAEHRVIAAASRVRDAAGEPWEVALTQDECNAWLAQRLPEWTTSLDDAATSPSKPVNSEESAPSQRRREVRVSCRGEGATFGIRDGQGNIVWATPSWSKGVATIQRCGVGCVRIPLTIARQSEQLGGLEKTIKSAMVRAVRLPDGRRVRIDSVRGTAGVVTLAGVTLAAE